MVVAIGFFTCELPVLFSCRVGAALIAVLCLLCGGGAAARLGGGRRLGVVSWETTPRRRPSPLSAFVAVLPGSRLRVWAAGGGSGWCLGKPPRAVARRPSRLLWLCCLVRGGV